MKILRLGIALVLLVLLAAMPAKASAQGEPEVISATVETAFPAKLQFKLAARAAADFVDVRLHYTVEREDFAEIVSEIYISFTPGTDIDISWDWDMRQTGGLPPGSQITYWWTLEAADGKQVTTSPAELRLDDNRYPWQSISGDNVTIYWYTGSQAFAGEILAAARQALARLAADTGASLKKPVRLYIYNGANDLQGALVFPQEWTGGVAFTRYSTIAIGITPDSLDWGKGAVTHELTHLVVDQMTLNPYGGMPVWLDEGLAMYTEGEPGPEFIGPLQNAVNSGKLISVRSLASPFSSFRDEAVLSYAESYSIVDYLIRTYGRAKMQSLLESFRAGITYDDALLQAYGFNADGLFEEWRAYVTRQYGTKAPVAVSAGLLPG